MRYTDASIEPLEIIRRNECEGIPCLTRARFQALWNEIEKLRSELDGMTNELMLRAIADDKELAAPHK